MIKRDLQEQLIKSAKYYPVVSILGPRQSGKTTLAKNTFINHKYVSLEDLDMRKFAKEDPRAFLETYKNEHGIILDEFQNVPDILSYIQTYVDTHQQMGYFVLTGSQNFLVNETISQTLAGRISINTLLPLSISELNQASLLPDNVNNLIYKGFYPAIYSRQVPAELWYHDYLQTYVERDVRQITQVTDLSLFQTFVRLCAGRIGQLLNLTSLANDCGISDHTARRWISLLEASYIIFLVQPHHKNFSKRLIKSPKIYFYDTGFASYLLNISPDQLFTHYLRGGLFECLVIAELYKHYYNAGQRPQVYFWRDVSGNEIDCILERGQELIPIEIKSGMTISENFFSGLKHWNTLATGKPEGGYLVYGGYEDQKRTVANILSWKHIDKIFEN